MSAALNSPDLPPRRRRTPRLAVYFRATPRKVVPIAPRHLRRCVECDGRFIGLRTAFMCQECEEAR